MSLIIGSKPGLLKTGNFRRSGPPQRIAKSQASGLPAESVTLSERARPLSGKKKIAGVALLAGMAALGLAASFSAASSPAACVVGPCQVEEFLSGEQTGAPFQMVRQDDGEVAFHTGVGDRVVYPDLVAHKDSPEATLKAKDQLGESVCKQALDLGGRCDSEDIAYVDTPHGTLIIEQNDPTSVDIFSMDGGHVRMSAEKQGAEVNTNQGTAVFSYDGNITYK